MINLINGKKILHAHSRRRLYTTAIRSKPTQNKKVRSQINTGDEKS